MAIQTNQANHANDREVNKKRVEIEEILEREKEREKEIERAPEIHLWGLDVNKNRERELGDKGRDSAVPHVTSNQPYNLNPTRACLMSCALQ